MKRVALLLASAAFLAGLIRAEDKVVKEDWDWATAMIAVVKKGKDNKEGVVLSLGDSITYANQSTRWAKSLTGATPEDKAVCQWSHAGKNDDTDGWWLAAVDRPSGRSETAASGVRTDEYLKGGKGGLPPLKAILEKYKPQAVFVLLGANDASAGRKPEDAAKDMAAILDAILANGTIPVLQTVAPRSDARANEFSRKYNELFLALARERKIPIVDLYGEFVTRAPNDAWKTALLSDGVHFTHGVAGGPPTEENLAKCGYLLRCWLSVQKLKDIKKDVIDKAR
jgi:lysophospholipase L1-like esterase